MQQQFRRTNNAADVVLYAHSDCGAYQINTPLIYDPGFFCYGAFPHVLSKICAAWKKLETLSCFWINAGRKMLVDFFKSLLLVHY